MQTKVVTSLFDLFSGTRKKRPSKELLSAQHFPLGFTVPSWKFLLQWDGKLFGRKLDWFLSFFPQSEHFAEPERCTPSFLIRSKRTQSLMGYLFGNREKKIRKEGKSSLQSPSRSKDLIGRQDGWKLETDWFGQWNVWINLLTDYDGSTTKVMSLVYREKLIDFIEIEGF